MLNPRTPGVYVQEISLLPPSVAPVATAIPAFIGYTQKRGNGFPEDTPKRITSLIDYEQIFGGPFDENYTVQLTDDVADPLNPKITVTTGTAPGDSPYLLYYAVQHYFANGGGPCYVVSIGLYDYDAPAIDPGRYTDGIDVLEQEDEPTLIVVPEAVVLDTLKRTDLHNQMLAQCNKMQDRFALMDVLEGNGKTTDEDASEFRDEVGIAYLKYGAAYYPSLKTTITKYYDEETVNIQDDRGGAGLGDFHGEPLSTLLTGTTASVKASGQVEVTAFGDITTLEINDIQISFKVEVDEDTTASNLEAAIVLAGIGGVAVSIAGAVVTVAGAASINFIGAGAGITIAGSDVTVADISLLTTLEVDGQQILFDVGADDAETAENIKTEINDNGLVTVSADIDPDNDQTVLVTADAGGLTGNTITLVKTGAGITVSGATLSGGAEEGKVAASTTLTITSGFKKILDKSFTIGAEAPIIASEPAIVKASAAETAEALANAINGLASVAASSKGTVITITYGTTGVVGNDIALVYSGTSGARFSGSHLEGGTGGDDSPDVGLYQRILTKLSTYKVNLYPSAAMAGIYARVDRNRGVWKAPANVSVNMVQKPNVMVSADEQGSLNVDPNTGKSINVIRSFAGKGTLVWGARTLAGNDNEWRYVPVRRLFIFIEESIEKASEPFVFEPNDANTWVKMKGMIENFLTSLWRDGALAGAAPSDAFFVKVGLGETMTAVDILEGRLNIEVGIAAVRPAEFIILKFSHKLQES